MRISKIYVNQPTTWVVGRVAIQYSDWLRTGRSGDRIPVEARFSTPVQTGPGAHPASCTMGTGSFTGVKSGRGVTLTPSSEREDSLNLCTGRPPTGVMMPGAVKYNFDLLMMST